MREPEMAEEPKVEKGDDSCSLSWKIKSSGNPFQADADLALSNFCIIHREK